MAFNSSNLTRVGVAGDQYIFDYTTTDNIATVEAITSPPRQFYASPSYDVEFRSNDIMRVTASDGKAIYMVTNNSPALRKLADVDSFPSL